MPSLRGNKWAVKLGLLEDESRSYLFRGWFGMLEILDLKPVVSKRIVQNLYRTLERGQGVTTAGHKLALLCDMFLQYTFLCV